VNGTEKQSGHADCKKAEQKPAPHWELSYSYYFSHF
jgi:hypothetical protein